MQVRLRQIRERLLVTQAELSERAGITESTLSRIENGLQRPRLSTLRKLAEALEVSPDELVDWKSEPEEGNSHGLGRT